MDGGGDKPILARNEFLCALELLKISALRQLTLCQVSLMTTNAGKCTVTASK